MVAIAAAFLAVVAGLVPATHAYATPNPQEVEAQIDQLWAQLEPLIEEYNGVHDQLNKNLAKQAELAKQLEPLQMQVDLAMSRVGAISAKLYETGPGSNAAALLSAGSPDALLSGLAMLDQVARHQQQTISVTKDQLNQYNQQKAPLDALVAQQRQQDADLAAKKQKIQAQVDELQKLRTQAYGSSRGARGKLKPAARPGPHTGGAGAKAGGARLPAVGWPREAGGPRPAGLGWLP